MSRCEQLHPDTPFIPRKNARGCKSCTLVNQRLRRAGLEAPALCHHCGVPFPSGKNRTFCEECAPTRADWERINKYGIDRFQFNAMYFEQDGACAICRIKEATHVDHDHRCCPSFKSCGRCVRALLCVTCNSGIGNLGDSPELLRGAANYIEDYL